MDIKKEVHRRITDLTRLAYERGYRDGAQSALAEIENVVTEDVIEQTGAMPAPLEAIAETKAVDTTPFKVKPRRKTKKQAGSKPKPTKAGRTGSKPKSAKPKSIVVQEALQSLLAEKGEARRDEVLTAAQTENPAITKHDLNNGLRTLARNDKFRVAPGDKSLLLPA